MWPERANIHWQHGAVSSAQHTPAKCQVDEDGDVTVKEGKCLQCLARGRLIIVIVSVLFSYNSRMVWASGTGPSKVAAH